MKKKYYMIGNAHLDPVWMWRWQEGCAEAKATVRSALDRMKENPDFKFVCSSASIYAWIEDSAPDMLKEIRQRVAEGRWIVVGGWWVQPDCNLPSGEGFARQSLYSQRYFKEKLGTTAQVGYCVDSFGHNRMIPQILRKSGMDSYIFMRPGPHELNLPFNLFLWESPDGSQVTACRIPDPYCCNFTTYEELEHRLQFLSDYHADGKSSAIAMYGVGNHGGGPTIQNIALIHEFQQKHSDVKLEFGNPHDFFTEVSGDDLPVWQDDLQHHAAGCYAATSMIKSAIRRGEVRLLSAERFSFLASVLSGHQYPTERFAEAWKNILFLHFHDIAGGCAEEGSYSDSMEFAGEALSTAAKIQNGALQSISWKIDTRDRGRGLPIILFNSLPRDIACDVVINKQWDRILDNNGNPVPVQHVNSEVHSCFGRDDTVFKAVIPALGYTTYYMKDDGPAAETDNVLTISDDIIENANIRAEFDPATGFLISLYDKIHGIECLSAPAMPVVHDESDHDTWSHAKNIFNHPVGVFTAVEKTIKENGPVRAILRIRYTYHDSSMVVEYTLSHDSDMLELNVILEWHEKHKMLKLNFPVNTGVNSSTFYQIPYGWIERPCNQEEEPGQMWVALQGKSQGLCILNDQKYSSSADGNTLSVTAIRSPIYGDHGQPENAYSVYTDQGEHRFRYALFPYMVTDAYDFSNITQRAEEFNNPPTVILENNHEGSLCDCYRGTELCGDGYTITAMKRAEEGDGWIVRLNETAGKSETANIRLPLLGQELTVNLTPFTIKTLKLSDNGQVAEVLLTEFEA